MKKQFTTVFLALSLGACSTVTINPSSSAKLSSEPSYQQRKNFFFWGLAGEHRVDVTAVCAQQNVAQMQSQQTFVDGLLGAVTLGIYAPHSVKVWCN
ncbi:Bor family protein [Zhongshania guokunii]|uniref:Bor family protein n=1 Tax=Zhongshania guokunii TaxID=641783 RepID=A0ABV3U8G2_9GAMM